MSWPYLIDPFKISINLNSQNKNSVRIICNYIVLHLHELMTYICVYIYLYTNVIVAESSENNITQQKCLPRRNAEDGRLFTIVTNLMPCMYKRLNTAINY